MLHARLGNRRSGLGLALIWMTAFSLRAAIFSLTPVLPQVRSELHLSFALTGSISSITVLCLGLGALPGAALSRRLGPVRLIGLGSFALVVGGAARLLAPGAFWLPFGTGLATLGLAVSQPAVIALIRTWFPKAIQRASTVFINAQQLGSLAGFALTPLFVPGLGWRGAVDIWTGLALLSAVVWVVFARAAPLMGEQPTALDSLLRDPRLWIAAALVAAESTTYFTAATWLPFLLRGANAGYISLVFFLMNAVAVVPTLLVVFRWRFASSVSFYVAAGVVGAAGAVSMLLGMREWIWLGALGVGLGSAMGYQGIIAAIPKLARRETDVAAYAAAVLAIGYGMAFLGPAIGGVIVDWTDRVDWAFGPAVASGVLMIGLGFMAGRFRGDERGSEGRANG